VADLHALTEGFRNAERTDAAQRSAWDIRGHDEPAVPIFQRERQHQQPRMIIRMGFDPGEIDSAVLELPKARRMVNLPCRFPFPPLSFPGTGVAALDESDA